MRLGLMILVLFLASTALSATDFCSGKAAGTFYCLDDTSFQHCTGDSRIVIQSCPAHLCVTRTPAERNPCVGRDNAAREDGIQPPVVVAGTVVQPTPPVIVPPAPGNPQTPTAPQPTGAGQLKDPNNPNSGLCAGGPKFDPAGPKNFGNGHGGQFITGQCKNNSDCGSGCCAGPCGICSGPAASFQNFKTGCGFIGSGK